MFLQLTVGFVYVICVLA